MNKKAKSILAFSIISLAIVLCSILIYNLFVSASGSLNISVTPSVVNQNESYLFNFTIDNTDSVNNITEVTINTNNLIGYVGDPDLNGTSVTAPNSFVWTNSQNIHWRNTTSAPLINMGESHSFWFNATATLEPGSLNKFDVVTIWDDGAYTFTDVYITINPLTPPPSENCNIFNGDQTSCETYAGCTWQDSCYGSIDCSFFGDQPSCESLGCSWDASCSDFTCSDQFSCEAIFGCGSIWNSYCDDGTCSDQSSCETAYGCGSTWNGTDCEDTRCTDQPTCEAPLGCGSIWNEYCDDGRCSDQPSCEQPFGCGSIWNAQCTGISSSDCTFWNNDQPTCLVNGCGWQDSCTGTYTPPLSCGDTITSDTTLTSSLTGCTDGLIIGANDITLDCDGFSISGGNAWLGTGLNITSYNNITIQNCNFDNFEYGIKILYSDNNSLINNNISSNGNGGLSIDTSNFNTIESNTFNDANTISFYYANNNTFIGNNLTYCSYGLRLLSSNDNIFINNSIDYSNNPGIFMQMSDRNNFTNNNIAYNSQEGIFISDGCNNNLFSNNNFTDNYYDGIYLGADSNSDNTFTDSYSCYNNQAMSIYYDVNDLNESNTFTSTTCDTSNPNGLCDFSCPIIPIVCGDTITENTILTEDMGCDFSSSTEYALAVGSSDVVLDCDGHSITGNGIGMGVKFNGVSGATIKNCEISGFAQGILSGNAVTSGNYILNNILNNNSQYGIAIRQANDYTIADNNINNSGTGIRIVYSYYADVYENTITNTIGDTGRGISLSADASENTIRDNRFESNNVSIYSADSQNNIIHNNTIINPFDNGIYLYNAAYTNVTNNIIQNADIDGIHLYTDIIASNNLVQGNIISLSENDSGSFVKHGMVIEDDNNQIIGNVVDCTSIDSDYTNMGIWIRGFGGVAENNILSGNEISNCYYGFSAWSADYFEAIDEDYHDNTYGAYLQGAGTSSTIPIIADSEIYDNSHGVYLQSNSYAAISNTNFTDNTASEGGGPRTGLHVDSTSTAQVLNCNFIGNGQYGIYDELPDTVEWLLTEDVTCRNNDIRIYDGFILPFGGSVTRDNCTVTMWNGTDWENLTDDMFGFYTEDIDTETGVGDFVYTVGSPDYGIEGEIHTSIDSTGDITLKFYTEPPEGGPSFKLDELGTWIDFEVTGDVLNDLSYWILKIYYTDEQIAAAGLDENDLKIQYYNNATGKWEAFSDGGVNTTGKYVWANVTHFSLFGVGASTGSSSTGGSNGGTITILNQTEENKTIYIITMPNPSRTTFDLGTLTGNKNGRKITIGFNETFRFVLNGVVHVGRIVDVTGNRITLMIWSDPIQIIGYAGDSKQIDLDGDGKSDISLTFNSIKDGKVDLTFKEITLIQQTNNTGTNQPSAQTQQKEGLNKLWTWIIVGALGLCLIIFIYSIAKSGKKRRY